MDFRKYYCNETGIKLNSSIHIHHIDKNRKNNHISNLVNLPGKFHIKYHKLYYNLESIKLNIELNNWSIDDFINDNYIRSFCLPFLPQRNWSKKLINKTIILNNYIIKRNKKISKEYPLIQFSEDDLLILKCY